MFRKAFWLAATERAIKSASQAIILLAIGDKFFDAFNFDWKKALGTALGAALLSYLYSLVSANVPGSGSGPSLTTAEELAPVR